MAQGFYQAFGLGKDDKHLAPRDLASVAVVGVQAVNNKVNATSDILEKLKAENNTLKARLTILEKLVSRLDQKND